MKNTNTNKVLVRFFDQIKEVDFPIWEGTFDVTFQTHELERWWEVKSVEPLMLYFPQSDSILEMSLDRFIIPARATDITITISFGC